MEKNKLKYRVFLVGFSLLSALFCSCGRQEMPAQELVQWVKNEENGLVQNKEIGGVRIEIQYKPSQFVLAQELLNGVLKPEEKETREKELKGMHYFDLDLSATDKNLNISNAGLTSSADVQSRLYYFSFGMKEDLKLESGGKEIPCKLYHFERSSDLTPRRKFLLGFPAIGEGDITLVFDSKEFSTGPVKFQIDQTTLNSIPLLSQ